MLKSLLGAWVLVLAGLAGSGHAATINIELTSRGLGIGTAAFNDGGTVDPDVAGKIVTSPTVGQGSILTVQTDGKAGAGTVPNPLLMTVTAGTHLDIPTGLPGTPHDYFAGVIFLTDGDGAAPIVFKDEGLGVRAFTVDTTTALRTFSGGRAEIEGSKEVSGGTGEPVFNVGSANGPPHVDENVKFDFNPGVAVLASTTSFLLTKFETTDKINISVKLTDGTVITNPVDTQLGIGMADIPAMFTQIGPAGDKVVRVNLSALPGIAAGDLLDSVTVNAVDDNPADPSGTAEHFLINGMVLDTTDLPTIKIDNPIHGTVIVGCTSTLGATVTNDTDGLANLDYTVTAGLTTGAGTLGAVSPAGGSLAPDASQNHTVDFTGAIGLNTITLTVTSPAASNSPQNIQVTQTVLDHSDAAFQEAALPGDGAKTFGGDLNSLTIDFGTVGVGGGTLTSFFDILAAITTAGFTAGLDMDEVATALASPALSLGGDLATFTGEAAGEFKSYHVAFDTSALGVFTAIYQFKFSDQNISECATAPGSEVLTLTVTGTVVSVPEPAAFVPMLFGLALLAPTRPRRR